MRVAVLGGVAFALFALIFFRLWFLQVLSGDQYLAQARENRVRKVKVEAPRGEIVDRNGTALVTTRQATAVQLVPRELPAEQRALVRSLADGHSRAVVAAERTRVTAGRRRAARVPVAPLPESAAGLRRLYARLGRVLDVPPARIHREVVRQVADLPYADVTVKTDVSRSVLSYISERQHRFPGVAVRKLYLRDFPRDDLAAQLFGTVSEITPEQLKLEPYRGVEQGTRIGQDGIEQSYDRYLRGTDGFARVQIDALGRPKGAAAAAQKQPVPGRRLKLSLDYGLQKEGQRALGRAMAAARGNGNAGSGGAFVALDPRNGEVLALGSAPSFDANVFARPLSRRTYARLSSEQFGSPLFNRAIAGALPTGSTFKPITAIAGLQSGLITPQTVVDDPGFFQLSPNQRIFNARQKANGAIDLRRALQVSSDVFFYKLGFRANGIKGQVVQSWARRLGLDRVTGIDLPGETGGEIPDKRWRAQRGRLELRCRKRRDVPSCGISDARPWSVGDNVNLAVGQGDVQATPLQMAVAYAALANGGKVVRPHLGLEAQDAVGAAVERFEPEPARRVKLAEADRVAVMEGLRRAAMEPGGTSQQVFAGFGRTVYGKTGTVERPPKDDQSWYVCYVPDKAKPIVLAVTVEQGGFGAEAAAPAARLMLSEWFGIKKQFLPGASADR